MKAIPLPVSKRGAITIPSKLRRRMGLDVMESPMLIMEEREGGLFLQPAAAVPVRDIARDRIQAWIRDDEDGLRRLRGRGKKM